MRIICRPGTMARFALLCIILGIVLGFFLGTRVRVDQTAAPAIGIGSPPARAHLAPDAGASPGRQIAATVARL